ncbi:MAG TPA: hypothetical protein VEB21_16895, partial [Terriglobales bacterium]|nr:hypothetical protein [Terriglobales bacterium]
TGLGQRERGSSNGALHGCPTRLKCYIRVMAKTAIPLVLRRWSWALLVMLLLSAISCGDDDGCCYVDEDDPAAAVSEDQ